MPDRPTQHPDFLAAYARELGRLAGTGDAGLRHKPSPGSIREAVLSYIERALPDLSPGTIARRRPILDEFCELYGQGNLRTLTAQDLQGDLKGRRGHARNNRLKVWRALLRFAVEEYGLPSNPALEVARGSIGKTRGHEQWTTEDVARFRSHWPYESAPRLAFELLQWTGCRIADAVSLTERHVSDGFLVYRQGKTGGDALVPWAESAAPLARRMGDDLRHLHRALDARPERHVAFITIARGAPRSVKAASQWFAEKAREAGIVGKSAHGLRKRRTALLIEAGASRDQAKAWTGHESDNMVTYYAKRFDRRKALAGTNEERESSNFPQKFQEKAKNK